MRTPVSREHKIDTLFTILLFSFYLLLLLMLLLFSSNAYQASVRGTGYNQGLVTAMSYVTEKIHQHDTLGGIQLTDLEGSPALCLRDQIEGQTYVTYIYQDGTNLKELFTKEGSNASLSMGTAISDIQEFEIAQTDDGFLSVQITDSFGNKGNSLLSLVCREGGGS